ncbi:uncharacterized protein PSFLO_03271 [Pseudozyma flocculosa]|uniref:Uncharacterized protein n=1 Tax=Pseudozyma flocculosa TaxID=84751 RepID=A0A5C3F1A5_9BASI|nr:uncharacterized protein PSFLO_03271 [Pseudozyma flocculosa]
MIAKPRADHKRSEQAAAASDRSSFDSVRSMPFRTYLSPTRLQIARPCSPWPAEHHHVPPLDPFNRTFSLMNSFATSVLLGSPQFSLRHGRRRRRRRRRRLGERAWVFPSEPSRGGPAAARNPRLRRPAGWVVAIFAVEEVRSVKAKLQCRQSCLAHDRRWPARFLCDISCLAWEDDAMFDRPCAGPRRATRPGTSKQAARAAVIQGPSPVSLAVRRRPFRMSLNRQRCHSAWFVWFRRSSLAPHLPLPATEKDRARGGASSARKRIRRDSSCLYASGHLRCLAWLGPPATKEAHGVPEEALGKSVASVRTSFDSRGVGPSPAAQPPTSRRPPLLPHPPWADTWAPPGIAMLNGRTEAVHAFDLCVGKRQIDGAR